MQPNGLGKKAGGNGGQQHEGEALAAFGAEGQGEAGIDKGAQQQRDREKAHHLAQVDR